VIPPQLALPRVENGRRAFAVPSRDWAKPERDRLSRTIVPARTGFLQEAVKNEHLDLSTFRCAPAVGVRAVARRRAQTPSFAMTLEPVSIFIVSLLSIALRLSYGTILSTVEKPDVRHRKNGSPQAVA
jgi:hypothetical protein